jgi:hypothetical protein
MAVSNLFIFRQIKSGEGLLAHPCGASLSLAASGRLSYHLSSRIVPNEHPRERSRLSQGGMSRNAQPSPQEVVALTFATRRLSECPDRIIFDAPGLSTARRFTVRSLSIGCSYN